jgi:hypothetical protein
VTASAAALSRRAAQVYPRYLDAHGAVAYLSLGSIWDLYRLVRQGLPASRLGRGPRARYRFDRLRVDVWMEEQAVAVAGHEPMLRRVK